MNTLYAWDNTGPYITTCKFLVMKSFFCSGLRVAGSTAKEAFPFNRISGADAAIFLQRIEAETRSRYFSGCMQGLLKT
jgi:hypothetical protein